MLAPAVGAGKETNIDVEHGNGFHRNGKRARELIRGIFIAIVIATMWLSGCRAAVVADPAAIYQSIHEDFVRGDFSAASGRAKQLRSDLAAGRVDDALWSLKFRLLEAEALLMQDRPQESISLLGAPPSFPAGGDPAIKRHLILSGAFSDLDRPRDSSRELHAARRLAESAKSALMGEVLRAEALVERNAGHWGGALDKLEASLLIARQIGDRWLETKDLVDLGFVNLQNEHYDQAALLSQEAVTLAQSLEARNQVQLALGNLGWALLSLGEFEQSLSNFRAAERYAGAMRRVGSQVRWLQDAGLAEYKLGNLKDAQHDDELALAAAMTLPTAEAADLVANIESNLALLSIQQQQYDAAMVHSDRAVASARQSRNINVGAYAMLLRGLVATRKRGAEDPEPLLLEAHRATTDLEIRMNVENALAKLTAGRHRPQEAEVWYRRSIQTFEKRRATVHGEAMRLPAFAYGDAIYRDFAEFLLDSRRPVDALRALDRGRSRTLEDGLGMAGADPAAEAATAGDVQSVARKLAAPILFYSLGPDKSWLWVVTALETRVFDLPRQPDIRAQVEAYQREIQKSGDPLRSGFAPALGLYDVLIKPAAGMIPPGAIVYIVPDGILHELNFETLIRPDGSGFKYWIEDATVITASSIRLLSRPHEAAAGAPRGSDSRDLLLIGDPVQAANEFEPLPNAAEEIQRVREHFGGARQTVLAQARAVPAAYTSAGPERYRYIHFVAHGTASRVSPLDSAVILSPNPGSPEDFKLYARDVLRHPLKARLVTISACNGAGLRTYAGEGLVGLAWAFLRAGAHDVIGALWQADDGATPLIMDRLYAELEAGAPPEAALRTAKLALIHSSSVYRKPLYWGGFQLYAGS